MPFYVAFKKEPDRGKLLPRFLVLSEKPEYTHRVYELNPGDCIDAADIHFGDDTMTWIKIDVYQVSNIDDVAKTEFLESYTMPYVR